MDIWSFFLSPFLHLLPFCFPLVIFGWFLKAKHNIALSDIQVILLYSDRIFPFTFELLIFVELSRLICLRALLLIRWGTLFLTILSNNKIINWGSLLILWFILFPWRILFLALFSVNFYAYFFPWRTLFLALLPINLFRNRGTLFLLRFILFPWRTFAFFFLFLSFWTRFSAFIDWSCFSRLFFRLLLLLLVRLPCEFLEDNFSDIRKGADDIMERLDCPADDVEPDNVVMNEVDDQGKSLLFIQVERDDQDQPEKGRNWHQYNFESAARNIRSKHVQLSKKVASLDYPKDHSLGEKVVDEEGVDSSEEEREDRLLQGFKENCS